MGLHLFNRFKRIMVVEDDPVLGKTLSSELQDEGFSVFPVTRGIDIVPTALRVKPHLILLDLMLPGMNGMAALEELRKDEWGKDAKVLILSNLMADGQLSAEADRLRACGYIEKNTVSQREIIEQVYRHL